MKRIAKLTWLHNGNYGTALQAVALHTFLVEKGYDVIDLDYKASTNTKLINWLINKNSPDLFIGKFKEFFGKKSLMHSEEFESRYRRIDSFISENIKLSEKFTNPNELKRISNEYDIFLCGSDQIWSPYLLNPVFYFDFLPDNKIKISYATSFGVTTTTTEKENKIKKYLSTFSAISVREKQGQEFVNKITGKDVPIVLDPTLLLSKETWNKFLGCGENKKNDESYIFCFLLTPNEEYVNKIRSFAIERNEKVIVVPTPIGPFNTGFEERIDVDPKEWMQLIKNASFVFTDSFHGFIFSIIFDKQFVVLKRFLDTDKRSQNSRIYSLANMLGINDHIIDQFCFEQLQNMKDLNYDIIDEIIEEKRLESSKWLLDAIEREYGDDI